MIQIIEESDDSSVVIKNHYDENKIVILFPMTRGKDLNLQRWQNLISTVNISKVAALVLIDKTPLRQASSYFFEKEKEIFTDVFIIQRPSTEPIHNSQARIRLEDGLWIIQLHDDDEWTGFLEIPFRTSENAIIKTQFTIVNDDFKRDVNNPNLPDCRSIFSLLPAKVWNRFVDLIIMQGGHVAGSIDSSLNLVVNLVKPSLINFDFRYFYDNRHWKSRRFSKTHLIQLTKEDGWAEFATVDISLMARAIDGIASLIFFRDFYSDQDFEIQLKNWIQKTKPHFLRIMIKRVEFLFLIFLRGILRAISMPLAPSLIISCNKSILYRSILLSSWGASEVKDYLSLIETLMRIPFLTKLQCRFRFWQSQLKRNST